MNYFGQYLEDSILGVGVYRTTHAFRLVPQEAPGWCALAAPMTGALLAQRESRQNRCGVPCRAVSTPLQRMQRHRRVGSLGYSTYDVGDGTPAQLHARMPLPLAPAYLHNALNRGGVRTCVSTAITSPRMVTDQTRKCSSSPMVIWSRRRGG